MCAHRPSLDFSLSALKWISLYNCTGNFSRIDFGIDMVNGCLVVRMIGSTLHMQYAIEVKRCDIVWVWIAFDWKDRVAFDKIQSWLKSKIFHLCVCVCTFFCLFHFGFVSFAFRFRVWFGLVWLYAGASLIVVSIHIVVDHFQFNVRTYVRTYVCTCVCECVCAWIFEWMLLKTSLLRHSFSVIRYNIQAAPNTLFFLSLRTQHI